LFWAAFPVLVIAGERLELAFQVLPGGRAWWAFQGGILATLGGALLGSFDLGAGAKLEALGFCVLALWMLRFDVLGRGFRQGGLQRFMSVALWTGYGWLFVAGVLLFTWATGLPAYWDGALHAVFLGFMFAMIFAHAPVIFPALSGVPLRWHAGHYGHLLLLSAGLSVRCASALFESPSLKMLGSYGAAGALGLFLLNQGLSVHLARSPKE
jgi:hypothetical protein